MKSGSYSRTTSASIKRFGAAQERSYYLGRRRHAAAAYAGCATAPPSYSCLSKKRTISRRIEVARLTTKVNPNMSVMKTIESSPAVAHAFVDMMSKLSGKYKGTCATD
jgi:hypothetical protein